MEIQQDSNGSYRSCNSIHLLRDIYLYVLLYDDEQSMGYITK